MSDGELPFKGVWVPAPIFNDARLSHSSKFLWAVIHVLSNERGCFATKQTLGRYLGVTERSVYTNLKELAECGYVRIADDGVVWDCVTTAFDHEENFMPTLKKTSGAPCSKLHTEGNKVKDMKKVKAEQPLDDWFIRENPKLAEVWDEYLAWRKTKRMTCDNAYINRWNKAFEKAGFYASFEAVNQSLQNGYQGIFIKSVAKPATRINTNEDHAKGF